jgi:ribosomal protein S27AE
VAEWDNFSFPSTGDPEKDADLAAGIRRSKARQAEGICPNGCGELGIKMVDYQEVANCSACGFTRWTFVGV